MTGGMLLVPTTNPDPDFAFFACGCMLAADLGLEYVCGTHFLEIPHEHEDTLSQGDNLP